MPQRVDWDPAFATGNEIIDRQHRALLAQCGRLAALCRGDAEAAAFGQAFEHLKALAREHFDVEAALRAADATAAPEALRTEREEFEYLSNEVATTANFDRVEVQRFVALWWLGHVSEVATGRPGPDDEAGTSADVADNIRPDRSTGPAPSLP